MNDEDFLEEEAREERSDELGQNAEDEGFLMGYDEESNRDDDDFEDDEDFEEERLED